MKLRPKIPSSEDAILNNLNGNRQVGRADNLLSQAVMVESYCLLLLVRVIYCKKPLMVSNIERLGARVWQTCNLSFPWLFN